MWRYFKTYMPTEIVINHNLVINDLHTWRFLYFVYFTIKILNKSKNFKKASIIISLRRRSSVLLQASFKVNTRLFWCCWTKCPPSVNFWRIFTSEVAKSIFGPWRGRAATARQALAGWFYTVSVFYPARAWQKIQRKRVLLNYLPCRQFLADFHIQSGKIYLWPVARAHGDSAQSVGWLI